MKKKPIPVQEELLDNLYKLHFEGLQPGITYHINLKVISYKYLEVYYFGGYWFSLN